MTTKPESAPPLPGAVRVDDTERDGEMVSTWQVRGGEELEALIDGGDGDWECQYAKDALSQWTWDGNYPTAPYLVRRKAEVQ